MGTQGRAYATLCLSATGRKVLFEERDKLMGAVPLFLSGVKSQRLKRMLDSWNAIRCLPSLQTFSNISFLIFAPCTGTR